MRLIDVDALPDDAGWCGDALIEAINNAPTIALESQWIPCSERLPDEFERYYLVTIKRMGDDFESYIEVDIAYFDPLGFYKNDEVIAWMPLPQPYEEE